MANPNTTNTLYWGCNGLATHTFEPSRGTSAPGARLPQYLPFSAVTVAHSLWLYQGIAVYQAVWTLRKRVVYLDPAWLFIILHEVLGLYTQHVASQKLHAYRNMFYWNILAKQLIKPVDSLIFTSG